MHRRINFVLQNSQVRFLHRQQILQRNYFGLLPPALLPAWNEAILQWAWGKLYPWCLEKAWLLKASPWDPETRPAAAVRTYQLQEEVTVQKIPVISRLPSRRQDFH